MIVFTRAKCLFVFSAFYALLITSCSTTNTYGRATQGLEPSRLIMAQGIKTERQLASFFLDQNRQADAGQVRELAALYIEEGAYEGVNSNAAFVQMCLETGFLRFGNLVTADMYNYCGLGSIDINQRGVRFSSMREGVRAHIQHLQAYGSTLPLNKSLVDPRYRYVSPRGKAPTVFALSGTWAADRGYGQKIDGLLSRLAAY